MDQITPDTGQQRPQPYLGLIAVAVLAIALGAYQWLELIQIRTGGAAPLCSISATINCATVWNSSLANAVHDYTGIPLAGWGIIWAVVVLLLGIELAYHTRKAHLTGDIVLALRLATASGALVSLVLLAYSIAIGVLCPTCFLFYILVAAAGFFAFRLQKDTAWAFGDGPVDAAYEAIRQATGLSPELENYSIRAVTSGKEALGEATVRIRDNGRTFLGRGVSTDIIEASAKAYVDAINRMVAAKDEAAALKVEL